MKGYFFLILIFFSLESHTQLIDSSMVEALLPSGLKNPKKEFRRFYGRTLDGKVFTIDSLKGKVSFINFWFEQCAPCITEIGALNGIYNEYKGNSDFQVLAFTYEDTAVSARVSKKYKIEYPIISLDKDVVYNLMYNLGFPTNMLVDKTGQIILIKCGGPINNDEAKISLNSIFGEETKKLLRE
jgi:thiol-disulfide isomerase/thioredoxin